MDPLAGLKAQAQDALARAAGDVVEKHVAPLVVEIREQLLARVTGDPPEGFVRAFLAQVDAAGWELDPEVAAIAWRATIAAIASEPVSV